MNDTRPLPHNLDIEQNLLGILICNPERLYEVVDVISIESFYIGKHRQVFQTILDMSAAKAPIDMTTVSAWIIDRNKNDSLLGSDVRSYITDLCMTVSSPTFLERLGKQLREYHSRRNLISIANDAATKAYDMELPAEDVMTDASNQILKIAEVTNTDTPKPMGAGARIVLDEILERSRSGGMPGIPTGFNQLDTTVHGFKPGELIYLAARPAMGKSALAMQMAYMLASSGTPALIFSHEMSDEQIFKRFYSIESGVIHDKLQVAENLTDGDKQALEDAYLRFKELPLMVQDASGFTLADIEKRAKRTKFEYPDLGAIFIDYLQLISAAKTHRNQNTNEEVSAISKALKQLARRLKIPIICLSQLNRAVELRQNKRPMLSDLRDSGSLEQDADIVMFVYRDEYYNPESEDRGIAEVIVAKNRSGSLGTARLMFQSSTTKFGEYQRPTFNFTPPAAVYEYQSCADYQYV